MYTALSPGAIGVKADTIEDAISAAIEGGFQGVEVNINEVASRVNSEGASKVASFFEKAGIRPAAWGLPVEWGGKEESWRKGMEELPRLAHAGAAIGCNRTMTWITPCSDTLPYDENLQFHIRRFQPIAKALAEEGCSLGLEFIGPKTSRESRRYQFIYRMGEMLEMCREIGSNAGLLLDCWHWYTSEGTIEEILNLQPEQVVYVHVNDAPPGVPIDEQMDGVRRLPGATGVIDIAGFLKALARIGYEGPVTPEPFYKELYDLESDKDRLGVVRKAMNNIMSALNI